MKLRNVKIDESIKRQFTKALEDEHTVLDPTTADALVNEEDRKKQIADEFKEVDKTTEEVIKATTNKETIKVKNRKELTKLLSENKNRGYKISRCLEEGYRYVVEWTTEPATEPEVLNEAKEEPVEESCELKEETNMDKIMRVLNMANNEPKEEALKEDNSYFRKMWKQKDDEEQFIQQMVCQLYSKFSDTGRSTIYDLVANLKRDFAEKNFDELYNIAEAAIVDRTMDDYLDTGNVKYLDKNYEYDESLKEAKDGKIGKGTVGEAINKNREKLDALAFKNKTEMVRAVSKILEDDKIEDKEYAKEVLKNASKKKTSADILVYLYDIMLKQIGLGSPDAKEEKPEEAPVEEPAEEPVEEPVEETPIETAPVPMPVDEPVDENESLKEQILKEIQVRVNENWFDKADSPKYVAFEQYSKLSDKENLEEDFNENIWKGNFINKVEALFKGE